MEINSLTQMLLNDLKNNSYKRLASWCGGMEHRGLNRNDCNTEALKKYILTWQNTEVFKKLPKYIELDESVIYFSNLIHNFVLNEYFETQYYNVGAGDILNAQDYYFIFTLKNFYSNNKNIYVLDFGAGYCRSLNYLLYYNKQINYTAVDAIPNSYIAQYLFLKVVSKIFNLPFYEHYFDKDNKSINGLKHIPTWELVNLPDNSYDLILCNQVLPELPKDVFEFVIKQLQRILKIGGKIYIRDHDLSWMPGHCYDINEVLTSFGFIKIYELFEIDKETIHGIPRIYTKTNHELSPHKKPQKEVNNFILKKIGNYHIYNKSKIAILGSAKAAEIAYTKCKEYEIEVICFIDDFKKGTFKGIEIVNREEFKEKYANKVDIIMKGPFQKGFDIKELAGIKIIDFTNCKDIV